MFSCEFSEISKNTFFTKHLWATTSKLKIKFYLSVANIASTFPPNSNSTFIVFLDRFPKAVTGRCSLKKCVLKIFAKFTGKRLCWSFVFKSYRPQTLLKTRLWHTFSGQFCVIFKDNFFHLWWLLLDSIIPMNNFR